MKKNRVLALWVIILVFNFYGCGSDEPDPVPIELEGTWIRNDNINWYKIFSKDTFTFSLGNNGSYSSEVISVSIENNNGDMADEFPYKYIINVKIKSNTGNVASTEGYEVNSILKEIFFLNISKNKIMRPSTPPTIYEKS